MFTLRKNLRFVFGCIAILAATYVNAAPASFEQAKAQLRQHVYYDRNAGQTGDIYCGCDWAWVGRSGGRVDHPSCGYQTRAQPVRAARIEWEHILPSHSMGHQRQCWQNGGRQNCVSTDPTFRAMETDLHNLTVSAGEINADRSNYPFGIVQNNQGNYGRCDFKVDFKGRVAEPRDEAKGRIARVYFYMHDRYGLSMSRQQQQLMMAWSKMFPVDQWELERDRRIARIMGHNNPFVTGKRIWTLGHKPSREGLANTVQQTRSQPERQASRVSAGGIRGNRNSKVYHLPTGCPSYDAMSQRNIVAFGSEEEALSAGYRKAGNCR